MTEMANFFKRLKVPKEINSRKRSSDDGNLSIVTSAAVAQNHPNDWARHVRSPLGKVSASTVRESTFDSGLSDNDLISVSVDEPSCSVKEGANSKGFPTRKERYALEKTSKEKDVVSYIRKRVKEAQRKGFTPFEGVRNNERKEGEKEISFRLSLRDYRCNTACTSVDVDDVDDEDYSPSDSKKRKPKKSIASKRKTRKHSSKRYAVYIFYCETVV